MKLIHNGTDWLLMNDNKTILSQKVGKSVIYTGCGQENVDMYRGNFKTEDYVIERRPLAASMIKMDENGAKIDSGGEMMMVVRPDGNLVRFPFTNVSPVINRFWSRVDTKETEHRHGHGGQMSYFNLHGRHSPLRTSEPGVGRDKTAYVVWHPDVENDGADGNYYNANYPQLTFISSEHYYLHVDSTAYTGFDFRNPDFHKLQVWGVPASIRIEVVGGFLELLERGSAFFGCQPGLPEWVYDDLVMDVQGGNERSSGPMGKVLENRIKVSGVWCQDWSGKRVTSFGKRLQWDQHLYEGMCPELSKHVEELHERGAKFLGYVNPCLVKDGELHEEGLKKGASTRKSGGTEYLMDFDEFYCVMADLMDPETYQWFKNEVIEKHIPDIGIDEWMVDFDEYPSADGIVLHSGKSTIIGHNHWPALWARCSYDALAGTEKLDEVVYLVCAGATGDQKHCTLLWIGSQPVDFTIHDSLTTVICVTLSAGMIGCGLSHSNTGSYTSPFGNTCTKELSLRWTEMTVSTPVMRTHECSRPNENFQYYGDEDHMRQLARPVDVYTMSVPYIRTLVAENAIKGVPVQRPMFPHYEQNSRCYDIQCQYILDSDMVVVLVYRSGQAE